MKVLVIALMIAQIFALTDYYMVSGRIHVANEYYGVSEINIFATELINCILIVNGRDYYAYDNANLDMCTFLIKSNPDQLNNYNITIGANCQTTYAVSIEYVNGSRTYSRQEQTIYLAEVLMAVVLAIVFMRNIQLVLD